MRQRTAMAVAAATVAVAATGTISAVAVTGGNLFGLGGASAANHAAPGAGNAASRSVVVTRTKYRDVKVVVPTTGAAPAAPTGSSSSASSSSSRGWSSPPPAPSAPASPPPSTSAPASSGAHHSSGGSKKPAHHGGGGTPSTRPPTTQPPTTQPPTTTPPTTTPSGPQQQTIQTADGSIDVQYTATSLTILAVHAAPGYSPETDAQGASAHIEFHGVNGAEVNISVQNGQLHWSVSH